MKDTMKMVKLNSLEGTVETLVKEINTFMPMVQDTILKQVKEAGLVGKHFRKNMLVIEQDGFETKVYVKKTGAPVAIFRLSDVEAANEGELAGTEA